jgi:hypothetical protein
MKRKLGARRRFYHSSHFRRGVASLTVPGPERYVELAPLLALMAGAILLAVGLLRAGRLAECGTTASGVPRIRVH